MPYKIEKQYRLKNYDYSQEGYYFITICAKDKRLFFGDIKNGKMELSKVGRIVRDCWLEIPQHFKNIELEEWVITPNHIHGIIIIENKDETENNIVSKFGYVIPGSLSTIIGSFKSVVTKKIMQKFPNSGFAWQQRFYDHIIRTEESLIKIREYIKNNIYKWEMDRNNEYEETEINKLFKK